MAILIEVRNGSRVVGRCDAQCYNVAKPHCDCICGGINHGVGLAKAQAATPAIAEDHIRQIAARRSSLAGCVILKKQNQLEIW